MPHSTMQNSLPMKAFRRGLKLMAIALIGTTIAAQAHAQRPDARFMSCGQVKTLVNSYNGVVMNFTANTYDRVVRNKFACPPGMIGEQKYTQTLDMPRCMVGYICVPSSRFKKF